MAKRTSTAPKGSIEKSVVKPVIAAKPTRTTVSASAAQPLPAFQSKPIVITLKQLAVQLGESHDLPTKQAEAMLDSAVGLLVERLRAGGKLRLNGLSVLELELKNRPARTGRNPATGETIQIATNKRLTFRPAKKFKKMI